MSDPQEVPIDLKTLAVRLTRRLPEGEGPIYTPRVLTRFLKHGMKSVRIGKRLYCKESWFDEFMAAKESREFVTYRPKQEGKAI